MKKNILIALGVVLLLAVIAVIVFDATRSRPAPSNPTPPPAAQVTPPAAPPNNVAELVLQLADPDAGKRAEAAIGLQKIGKPAMESLVRFYNVTSSPDVRAQIIAIIKAIDPSSPLAKAPPAAVAKGNDPQQPAPAPPGQLALELPMQAAAQEPKPKPQPKKETEAEWRARFEQAMNGDSKAAKNLRQFIMINQGGGQDTEGALNYAQMFWGWTPQYCDDIRRYLGLQRIAGPSKEDLKGLSTDLSDSFGIKLIPAENGVRVVDVKAGSPAAKAGLEPGDIINRVNGNVLEKVEDAPKVLGGGQPIKIEATRKGEPLNLNIPQP